MTDTSYHWKEGVGYSIFIPSFADSNGDGIGDLEGIIQKLDYIDYLGISMIWLSPIHPSPSYHKYDVVDYYDVHSSYGSKTTFRHLVDACHRRGIKVLLDLVVNHTSAEHPWFLESAKSKDSPYRNYYIWRDYEEVKNEVEKKVITLDSDNIYQWHANGDDPEHYYGFFWKGMPDLNFDNEEVRQLMYHIGRYWLLEFGVDGFRLDAAKHIYPTDQIAKTIQFWEEFADEMRLVDPEVILLGEVWDDISRVAPFSHAIPALFNFDLSLNIAESINSGSTDFIEHFINSKKVYDTFNPSFVDVIFLSNHDQNRIASELHNVPAKIKLAASILLTLPGMPFIYYGEELGMLGAKPDPNIREPFLWREDNVDEYRCSWMEVVHSKSKAVDPLELQSKMESSIFRHYKTLIALRKKYSNLFQGEIERCKVDADKVVCYTIVSKHQRLIVAHSLSEDTIVIPAITEDADVTWSESVVVGADGALTFSPYGSVIFLSNEVDIDGKD